MNNNITSLRLLSNRSKIIEMYEGGTGITELASKYDVKVNTLCKKLYIWGIRIRRGDWHKKNKCNFNRECSPELLSQRGINTRINNDKEKGIQYITSKRAIPDEYLISNIIFNCPVIK